MGTGYGLCGTGCAGRGTGGVKSYEVRLASVEAREKIVANHLARGYEG